MSDAYWVQVVVDCHDPHVLAAWWAQTLGWQAEPSDEAFIRRMVAEGYASDDDTRVFEGTLVWREGAAIRPPGDDPRRLRLLFQLVPEAKAVKNRMHLDVRTGDDDPVAVRARLVERGATVVGGGRQGPHEWVVLTDPEGNEFCV